MTQSRLNLQTDSARKDTRQAALCAAGKRAHTTKAKHEKTKSPLHFISIAYCLSLFFAFGFLTANAETLPAKDPARKIKKENRKTIRKVAKELSQNSPTPRKTKRNLISQLTKGKDQVKPTQPLPVPVKPPTATVQPTPVPKLAPPQILLKDDPELKNWIFYSADKKVLREKTWIKSTNGDPKEPILICLGKPFGYLRTAKEYSDFEFQFEWKFSNAQNGNSGVLIHTTGEDKIWPKAILVQLQGQKVGSIFPSGGAKTDNTVTTKDHKMDCTKWNRCVIRSVQGKVTVTINDKKMGEVTGCNPKEGTIGLQSQGAEVHFRKLSIQSLKEIKPPTPKPETKPTVVPPIKPPVIAPTTPPVTSPPVAKPPVTTPPVTKPKPATPLKPEPKSATKTPATPKPVGK